MSKIKWIMKQYWRIGTIRALASLGLAMLVLGKYYYSYIPILSDLGWIGAITLGIALIFVFLGLGWLYDQKARMWTQKTQAVVERNPYYYVPNIKNLTMEYPIFYTFIRIMRDLSVQIGYDSENINHLVEYMEEFFKSKPRKKDIRKSQDAASIFMDRQPFTHSSSEGVESDRPISSRVKLGFETQMLRLTWIQALTGLIQDVLIFGVLYVVVIFPAAPSDMYLFLSIFVISLPLLIFLTALGWYYDKKLRVWSADQAVKIERYPYSYVAEPYLYSRVFPFLFAFFTTMREVLKAKNSPYEEVDKILNYLAKFSNFSVSRIQDMREAQLLRESLGTLFQKNQGVNEDGR